MSSRQYHSPWTQGQQHVHMPLTILPQGSSAPKLGEGDPNASYFTITRNSAGNLTLQTPKFPALVNVRLDTSSGYKAKPGVPVQNTDFSWSIPIYTSGDTTGVASVGSITAGSGYTGPFAVTFTGGGGTGALGVATVSAGGVASVAITNPGMGYTSAPTPVFTAGGGTGASATAVLFATAAAADMAAGSLLYVTIVGRNSYVVP